MAIFEFTETTYIEAVWFVGDGHARDWMAVMFRDTPDSPWRAKYRFRYYASPDPDDPNDTKNVYELAIKEGTPDPRKSLVAALEFVAQMTLKEFGVDAQRWYGEIRGDLNAFGRWMRQQPFAHITVATKPPNTVQ